MKKILTLLLLVLSFSLTANAQKRASYTDYESRGNRYMMSHPITLYIGEQGLNDEYNYGKIAIGKTIHPDGSAYWYLRLALKNEGSIHMNPNDELYFGYPEGDVCVPVVTLHTEEGTPSMTKSNYVTIDYEITEDQIKTLYTSEKLKYPKYKWSQIGHLEELGIKIPQVLIVSTLGNIGESLWSSFQKNVKEEYDFIQKISKEKCKNCQRYKMM